MKNNKLIAIIGMILLVLVSFVFAAPQIDFFGITLANNAITSNTTVEINISINESNLKDLVYNWNGTNYTMYNDSLLLMLKNSHRPLCCAGRLPLPGLPSVRNHRGS